MCRAVRVHGEPPAGGQRDRPRRASEVARYTMHFDMHVLTDREERDVPRIAYCYWTVRTVRLCV